MSAQRIVKKMRGKLTLDHHILTSLLVMLTATTDLVSQTITLMVKHLAMLAHWDPLHQLDLEAEAQ